MGSRDYPQRVFALQNADETTVYSFGNGTYVGDKRPPWVPEKPDADLTEKIREVIQNEDAQPIEEHFAYTMAGYLVEKGGMTEEEAEVKREEVRKGLTEERARPMDERVQELYLKAFGSNPCIELDSGDTVWGMQCWWGPEDRYDEKVAGREVVTVPVPEGNVRWKE